VVALGSVQVLAAVRSAEVMVPVKALVVTDDCGWMAILSAPAVVEEKVTEPVPLRVSLIPILVSEPVAVHAGLLLAAALAKVR